MPIPSLLRDFGYYRKPRLLSKQVNAIAILNFREYAMSTITATDLKEVKDLITGDFSRINSN